MPIIAGINRLKGGLWAGHDVDINPPSIVHEGNISNAYAFEDGGWTLIAPMKLCGSFHLCEKVHRRWPSFASEWKRFYGDHHALPQTKTSHGSRADIHGDVGRSPPMKLKSNVSNFLYCVLWHSAMEDYQKASPGATKMPTSAVFCLGLSHCARMLSAAERRSLWS